MVVQEDDEIEFQKSRQASHGGVKQNKTFEHFERSGRASIMYEIRVFSRKVMRGPFRQKTLVRVQGIVETCGGAILVFCSATNHS